ncbi:MAG: hypothetical protein QGG87_03920 [Nitrospinota bacterium]|jgi:hypothetical protein|nr:hypothetical protein [Nitrospinota bacterium]
MKSINKIPVFEWFYEQGNVYLTILLSGSDLLEIPSSIHEKKVETFIVGNSPTPNLTYDKKGIEAPMRFGNNYFNCFFPWECIIMMSGPHAVIQFATERKIIHPTEKVQAHTRKYALAKKKKSIKKRGHLKVVK